MKILEFMNTFENWEERLISDYNIAVKHDGEYVLLKYNQLTADFTSQLVRECRGSIFRKDEEGEWICVCHPFDKFGNYGESYVPNLDWNSCYVTEKIDGSLIKVWFDQGKWNVSTNGTIDAYKAYVDGTNRTFGDLFEEAVGKEYWDDFLDSMNFNEIYMFELTSPYTRIVVPYDLGVYYLGRRYTPADIERFGDYKFYCPTIQYPKKYHLNNLDDCIAAVLSFSKEQEGLVAADRFGNRVKIKGEEYLRAAKLRNNGVVTTKRIIEMLRENTVDDFLAYCPWYEEDVEKVKKALFAAAHMMEVEYLRNKHLSFKDIAAKKDLKHKDYIFARMREKCDNAIDYIWSLFTCNITELVEEYVHEVS